MKIIIFSELWSRITFHERDNTKNSRTIGNTSYHVNQIDAEFQPVKAIARQIKSASQITMNH